ncbi:hypothetical protein ASF71_18520 [Deinococcus sp. Leaf326]|nr:hypothetical protein ASF71_18520 [Deinococcus sp. Leaf326]
MKKHACHLSLLAPLALVMFGLPAQAKAAPQVAAMCAVPLTLNGVWQADDGSTYVFRQINNQVWGLGRSKDGKSWTTVFNGTRKGPRVTGNWSDMTGTRQSSGTVTFQAERQYGFADFKRVAATGAFSGTRWMATCNDAPNIARPSLP